MYIRHKAQIGAGVCMLFVQIKYLALLETGIYFLKLNICSSYSQEIS